MIPSESLLEQWIATMCPDAVIFRYSRDFDYLWHEFRPTCQRTIIHWDKTPEDPAIPKAIKLGALLSPIDLAVSIIHSSKTFNTNFVIVDDDPAGRISLVPSYQLYVTLDKSKFSWLRLVTDPEDLKCLPPTQGHQLDREVLQLFRETLRSKLVGPYYSMDRHAVANLVGPLLLCKRPEDVFEQGEIHRPALIKLMRIIDLLPGRRQGELVSDAH